MKRNFLYKVMFLAMIAVVSMTFTACGGDSDDDGTPQVPTGPTGSTELSRNTCPALTGS